MGNYQFSMQPCPGLALAQDQGLKHHVHPVLKILVTALFFMLLDVNILNQMCNIYNN